MNHANYRKIPCRIMLLLFSKWFSYQGIFQISYLKNKSAEENRRYFFIDLI